MYAPEQFFDRDVQDLHKINDHGCADPVGAGFVFLKLLMADAETFSKLGERQETLIPDFPDVPAHALVDFGRGPRPEAGCLLSLFTHSSPLSFLWQPLLHTGNKEERRIVGFGLYSTIAALVSFSFG